MISCRSEEEKNRLNEEGRRMSIRWFSLFLFVFEISTLSIQSAIVVLVALLLSTVVRALSGWIPRNRRGRICVVRNLETWRQTKRSTLCFYSSSPSFASRHTLRDSSSLLCLHQLQHLEHRIKFSRSLSRSNNPDGSTTSIDSCRYT